MTMIIVLSPIKKKEQITSLCSSSFAIASERLSSDEEAASSKKT